MKFSKLKNIGMGIGIVLLIIFIWSFHITPLGIGFHIPKVIAQQVFDQSCFPGTQALLSLQLRKTNDHLVQMGCNDNFGNLYLNGSAYLSNSQTSASFNFSLRIPGINEWWIPANIFNGNSIAGFTDAGITQVFGLSGTTGSAFFNGTLTTNQGVRSLAFANLPTSPSGNGWLYGCTDCTSPSNPCTGGSTGALAVRQNGVWVCK